MKFDRQGYLRSIYNSELNENMTALLAFMAASCDDSLRARRQDFTTETIMRRLKWGRERAGKTVAAMKAARLLKISPEREPKTRLRLYQLPTEDTLGAYCAPASKPKPTNLPQR